METTNDFKLEDAIQEWRDNLGQSPQFRAENLDELEAHLRDSAVVLQGKGLSGEEAFLVAARRVGSAAALGPEFSKVNAREVWLNRGLWMLVGIQLWGLISSVSGMLSSVICPAMIESMIRFGYQIESAAGQHIAVVPAVLFFSVNVLALLSVAAGSWWLIRRNAGFLSRAARRRGWLVVGAVALCLVMFLRGGVGGLGVMVLAKTLGPQALGVAVFSMSIAGATCSALITITLATLTVLLARRQLRLASAP